MKLLQKTNTENPFFGMKENLKLFSNSQGKITEQLLENAYKECDTVEKKKLFYSLCFLIGDVTNRKHNIFKGKVDNGGSSNRDGFSVVLDFIRKKDKKQFYKFLNCHLFNEYQCFDSLLQSRVVTKKGTKTVVGIKTVLDDSGYRKEIAKYIVKVINGNNPFDKHLIAKFMTLPRLSKRKDHKQMLPETKKTQGYKVELLKEVSRLMNWEYSIRGNNVNFKGYRNWRHEYNGMLESVLFSTGKIEEFDKIEFQEWLDKLPSNARERVKNRVLYSKVTVDGEQRLRYPEFAIWYEEWREFKEKAQKEKAVLEEKERQGVISEEEKERLKQVKKEAKVNFGATSFLDIFRKILNGYHDKEAINSFIDKVNLKFNFLTFVDASGSMYGPAWRMAAFLATVFLYKNPDDDARDCIGFFSDHPRYSRTFERKITRTTTSIRKSYWDNVSCKNVDEPFIDGSKTFYENYERMQKFFDAFGPTGGTDVSSIIDGIVSAAQRTDIVDTLKQYPVWVILSDGEWNNLSSPEASINELFAKCEKYLGFKPFIIAIDITENGSNAAVPERFTGIDNFMYIPSNPSLIEQMLVNLDDIEVPDVYSSLNSIYKSNRYAPVRAAVLD